MGKIKNKIKSFIEYLKKFFKKEYDIKEIDVDNISDIDNIIRYINILCNRINQFDKEEKKISFEYRYYANISDDLERIQAFDKKNISEFEKLLSSLNNTQKERQELQEKIKLMNNEKYSLEQYEKEIPKILEDIEKAEERQRLVKSDMDYLEGEKGVLKYQKDRLQKTSVVVKAITIGLISMLGIAVLVLISLNTLYNKSIFVPSIIIFLLALFSTTWIYILKRYVEHELKQNVRKQIKAVELLNKAKIKYVRYTRFLEFEFKKYKVKSSSMLRYQWEQYKTYKNNNIKYKRISQHTEQIIENLEKILSNHNITGINYILDNLEKFQTKHQRQELYNKMILNKEQYKDMLEKLQLQQDTALRLINKLKYKQPEYIDLVEKAIEEKMKLE